MQLLAACNHKLFIFLIDFCSFRFISARAFESCARKLFFQFAEKDVIFLDAEPIFQQLLSDFAAFHVPQEAYHFPYSALHAVILQQPRDRELAKVKQV